MQNDGTFEWALDYLACEEQSAMVTRSLSDEKGNLHWRRVVFRDERGIVERWPSGHECLYRPTQEDMLANDWEMVTK